MNISYLNVTSMPSLQSSPIAWKPAFQLRIAF